MTLGEIKNAADNLWRADKDNSEKVAIAALTQLSQKIYRWKW